MTVIKPKKIETGDSIGVVAPSRYVHDFEKKINKGAKVLEAMGFNIVFGKNFKKRFFNSAGKIIERADDINEMFANKKIKAIICAVGGDSANQILEHINYGLIRENPKVIIGFSDITTLLLGIFHKASLITFHGPNLKDFNNLTIESKFFLNSLLFESKETPCSYPGKIEVIKHGKASGRLVGGNLFVINSLISSKFIPKLEKSILFWEDIDEDLSSIEFQLYQLKLSGMIDKISGMIIGNVIRNPKNKTRPLKDIVLDITKNLNIPIIKVDYFGHGVRNFYIFPIGGEAYINTKSKEFKLTNPVVC